MVEGQPQAEVEELADGTATVKVRTGAKRWVGDQRDQHQEWVFEPMQKFGTYNQARAYAVQRIDELKRIKSLRKETIR